jgi:hypothetical protein
LDWLSGRDVLYLFLVNAEWEVVVIDPTRQTRRSPAPRRGDLWAELIKPLAARRSDAYHHTSVIPTKVTRLERKLGAQ